MWTICKLAALAGLTAQAAAMALDSSFEALMSAGTEHRQLRAGRGQGGRGALDLNICGTRNAVRNGQTASPDTGTLHDDATDQAVDCTDGQSCGAAGANNGYGDNLNCHKTITAPTGYTVSLTFTSLALEGGAASGCAAYQQTGVSGCDVVQVYDGADTNAPLLGTYSGNTLPGRVTSTGTTMTVAFVTDTANWGLHNMGETGDPGFYADWHFTEHLDLNGDGICPAPAVYTDSHGTIHDDERSGVDCTANVAQCGGGTGDAGYADNTNCYTTIHAAPDQQIRMTFTQMNLELTGCNPGQPNGGCPPGGCDFVSVFDGQGADAPLIGKYSGALSGAALPSVVSSGEWIRIEFHTDGRNCGITNGEDPGWFADWDFVDNGQNICEPDSAVLRAPRGVLRDDDIASTQSYEDGGNGYGSALDCGVRIRGGAQATVNLHIVAMNLEGDGNGICGTTIASCQGDGNQGDFLKIYDGRDATAPLLAQLTGAPTDQVLAQDTFTSTGRDIFVQFVTDTGNYGLTGTTNAPGFYAEWEIISEGEACDSFDAQQGMAMIGHNNEKLQGMTPQQCEVACCARSWCRSFDYIASLAGGTCNLADVDSRTNMASTVQNRGNVLYERPVSSLPAGDTTGALGSTGCASHLATLSPQVNAVCCPAGGCSNGVPNTCSEECAALWLPFAKQCSEYLKTMTGANTALLDITSRCEEEEYGRYKANARNHRRGRCSDSDLADFTSQFAPACCGGNGEFCTGAAAGTFVLPEQNGQPHCSADCATFAEQFYSECHPRIEATSEPVEIGALTDFLAVCQGITPGSGHRRSLVTEEDAAVAVASGSTVFPSSVEEDERIC